MSEHAADVPSLVRAFVANDDAAVDPKLPALRRRLVERGAAECWHKNGTFLEHLSAVHRMLTLWGQPSTIRYCGLFHSAYSNEFVDLAVLQSAEDEANLTEWIGADAARLVRLACDHPRRLFIEALRTQDELPDPLTLTERGATFRLDRAAQQALAVVTLADLTEQWFEWQDLVWHENFGIARAADGAGALCWPGAMRPSVAMFGTASRLARHLRQGSLPTPPIFARCTQTLDGAAEREAAEAYVDAIQESTASVARAKASFTIATKANPFVGEPFLGLAQVSCYERAFEDAERAATRGLALLCDWGTPYDKRASWQAWIAWGRVLVEHARARRWPTRRCDHNNLGLVRGRARTPLDPPRDGGA